MKQKLSSFRLFSHRKMEFKLTWQYFLIWDKSFSISFLPISSFHLRQALVKAFFLDLLLLRFVKINTLSRIGTSSKSRQVANQELNRAEKYFSCMFKMPRLTKNAILRGRVQISKASSVFEDSRGNRIRSLSMKVGAFSRQRPKMKSYQFL